MTVGTFFSIAGWVVTGAVAGYIASVLLRAERNGCLVNIVLGIIGAFVGGFIMHNLLLPQGVTGWGPLDNIINAVIGAVVILVALELILPGKQLGVRKRETRSSSKRRGLNPLDWLE
jgi:uncharacterized membrane protein YeaQ/YmgE (transglycosylase-associated protein family)